MKIDGLDMGEELLLGHGKQIVFLHDQRFVAVNLHGLAAVLAEQRGHPPSRSWQCGHRPRPACRIAATTSPWSGLLGGALSGDHDARGGLGFVFRRLTIAIGEGRRFIGSPCDA